MQKLGPFLELGIISRKLIYTVILNFWKLSKKCYKILRLLCMMFEGKVGKSTDRPMSTCSFNHVDHAVSNTFSWKKFFVRSIAFWDRERRTAALFHIFCIHGIFHLPIFMVDLPLSMAERWGVSTPKSLKRSSSRKC